MEEMLETMEACFNQKLTETEKKAFEEKIASDEEWQNQWLLFQNAQGLLEKAVSLRLKSQMQQMDRPRPASLIQLGRKIAPVLKTRFRWTMLAVAATLVLLAAFWWLLIPGVSTYQDHFEPYEIANLRGNHVPAGDDWKKAYAEGDYTRAYGILQALDQGDAEQYFYQANAALELGRPEEAIAPLQKVLSSQSIRYTSAAEWYLYLAYWGSGDSENAKVISDQILAQPDHPYYSRVSDSQL